MGNIYLLTLLFIVTISSNFNNNKAHEAHSLPYQTTQPPSPSPTPSHAPSPSHHHHHHHHHNHRHNATHSPSLAPSPSYASAPPPSQPSKPLTPSPPPHVAAKAPTHAVKRQLVAVQGMVYCNTNCSKLASSNNTTTTTTTLFGASPLPGARVVLRCRNTPYLLRKTATTDKNGYFFMEAPTTVTTYGAHKCKVYLSHRPTNNNNNGVCSNATDLNNGVTGAYLFSNNTGPPKPLHAFSLFSVGPFAYVSATCA